MESPVGHCFLAISCGSWKNDALSCFVDDRAETWGECSKRIIEREATGADSLLLRSLAAIYPNKRLSVYRLRYGNGCSTIVKVQWYDGGVNSCAPLENAFVEVIVSVRPQNHTQVDPDKSVLGSFDGQKSGPSTKNVTLEFRLLAIDESPLRVTADKCHVIDIADGFGNGCTIKETSSEEVSSLLDAGLRCVNFRDDAVTDDDGVERLAPAAVAKTGTAIKHSTKHKIKPQPKKPKPVEERKAEAAPIDKEDGRKAAGGLPKGWTFIGPNASGRKNTRYFSPVEEYEFSSRPEVKQFLQVLRDTGGDEVEAAKLIKQHRKSNQRANVGKGKNDGDKKEASSGQQSKPKEKRLQKNRREAIKKGNPGKSAAEISSLVGKAWKALPDGQRKPYVDDAARKRAEYTDAIARYTASDGS
ncbi:hypothetical protein THAOC_17722 [Thalassiosira oceanica]|uniref:HMG box domain-containing protein n=1 Tax=Thalassiosira oceanica TaxID=159749 RepID=K0SU47_THAOC|nr:hypothetical protein THAOC_17722 [Thalassiosira oceanica]|eukprot:EJK61737.1 hypothetical protein THAOC_17722 [Thalassiosira oceanica]